MKKIDPSTFPWMRNVGKPPGVVSPAATQQVQVEEEKKQAPVEEPPTQSKPTVPRKRFIIKKIQKAPEPVPELVEPSSFTSTQSGPTPEYPEVASTTPGNPVSVQQEEGSVASSTVKRESRLVVDNLEDEFKCETCGERCKNWMLYIDIPCPDLCLSCHKCLYNNKMCRKCGRKLTQEEVEMVKIYYQTFQPEAWSTEEFLRANES